MTPGMSVPKVILVPTDFSERADSALDYAIDLARKLGAKITVMHAYLVTPLDVLEGALVTTEGAAERIEAAHGAALDATIEKRKDRGVELGRLLEEGEPRDSILAAAEEVGADLIVIGTHGRRGISRAVLGSVTEWVVRHATCPVLTVHARPAAAG
jgi:nucleotide-binding universal stress UspA family protein